MNYNYGYARVSADDQNLATQLDALDKAGCDKTYQEKVSGSKTIRPQLEELLKGLRPGDTVTVARFFRLGRNTRHLLELLEHFEKAQVRFVALDMGIDSSTPAGRLIMTIFAGLAQYQREEILEKTAHGRQLAVAAGTHMGRRKGADAAKLAKVKKALDAGLSVAQVVDLTNIPETTVKRYRKMLEAKQ